SAIFRVIVSILLFQKFSYLIIYRKLLYSNNSFYSPIKDSLFALLNVNTEFLRSHIMIILILGLVLSFMFLWGIGRNYTPIFILIILEITQRLNLLILNGGDNFIKFVIFYMIFIDSYSYFSFRKKENKKAFNNFLSN